MLQDQPQPQLVPRARQERPAPSRDLQGFLVRQAQRVDKELRARRASLERQSLVQLGRQLRDRLEAARQVQLVQPERQVPPEIRDQPATHRR